MSDLCICRICLNTAVKGYNIENYNLLSYYEYIVRQKLNNKEGLPKWVCYECATMLHKYHKFKEKCLQGQRVLQQMALSGNITYASVAVINRYSENLISPVGIAVASKRVKTTTFNLKRQCKRKFIAKIPTKLDTRSSKKTHTAVCSTAVERVEIKTETISSEGLKEDNVSSGIDNTFDGIHNNNIDMRNTNIDMNNANICTVSTDLDTADLDKTIQDEVKHENTNEVIQTTDPIKPEISESFNDKHLTNIFGINNAQNINNDKEKKSKNSENVNSDLENANYDSDVNFDITEHAAMSSDDESLAETVKKRVKVKRKPTRNKKTEPKEKKTKSENDQVELKNTKPKKHFLNPQFWKKISLNEEEAVREFKRREFDNDYYLKAKYKCQNCFKGFSKNDMLVRHLKHWHDESSGQVECRFCHMRFRHKHQLVKHMQEHLILHHCLQCNLQFPRLQAALAHQEHHNGIKRTCEHCGKEFNHLSTYYTHLRMSHKSSHVCVACGASFVSENGLHLHIKFKHFVESEQLEEKMRKQRKRNKVDVDDDPPSAAPAAGAGSDAEEIYCVKCDIKFMSRLAFNIHFFNSKNHDDDAQETDLNKIGAGPRPNSKPKIPTSCPHCHKDFPTRQGYIKHHKAEHAHIPLNIPKKRDICEVCGASIQMGSIQYHMKSHTGERDFACPAPACGMRFTLKYNMKRHYNVKHLGIPAPKYVRRTPGRRKKKTQEILENDFSPFVRTRTGYFL